MVNIDAVYNDILSLSIQGATNVAKVTLQTLKALITEQPDIQPSELKRIATRLSYARPTEPLAQNAVRYIFSGETDILSRIQAYETMIETASERITQSAASVLLPDRSYLTICHSSSVVSFFASGHRAGIPFSVITAETRPRYQGRTTATELLAAGIPNVTMVIDDVACSILETKSLPVDAVFFGADLLTETHLANKVGSLALALSAVRNGIPVYSITTLLKYDTRPFSPDMIEERPKEEVWPTPPPGLSFYTPAFDPVPYQPGIHIISEAGVFPSLDTKAVATKTYPFLLY